VESKPREIQPVGRRALDYIDELKHAMKNGVAATELALRSARQTRERIAAAVMAKKTVANIRTLWGDPDFRSYRASLGSPMSANIGRAFLRDGLTHATFGLIDPATQVLRPSLRAELRKITHPIERFNFIQGKVHELAEYSVDRVVDSIDGKSPLQLIIDEWERYLDLSRIMAGIHRGKSSPRPGKPCVDLARRGFTDGLDKVARHGESSTRIISMHDVDISAKDAVDMFHRSRFVRESATQHSGIAIVQTRIFAGSKPSDFRCQQPSKI
jgi:hypothetical protein